MNKWAHTLAFIGLISAATIQAQPLNYNLVNLSESASRSVERDEMTATLIIQEEGKTPAELTKKVTLQTNQLLQKARQNKALEVALAGRNSYRTDTKSNVWRETATITLTSKDFNAINTFIADVQSYARIQDISFTVSKDKLLSLENELTAEALQRLKNKALFIGKNIGLNHYQIVTLDIGQQGIQPVYQRMSMAKSASISMDSAQSAYIPEVEAGKQDVILRVSAQIQLSK
ncbi:SIMPL domain-containing protein [Neisseria sp. Ec49-e6-T10]|uniref:SIMPL domain-containing protein n=1 Tax=Neisseria sp. Ec49-e6-T10 TaxID=3140744 RepID=UPI003EBCAC5A